MVCQKCGSNNVNVQVINEVEIKNKHHGVIWWLFIGWWWIMIKWMIFTIPALLIKLFGHKKQKAVNTKVSMCVCQDCGNTWKI